MKRFLVLIGLLCSGLPLWAGDAVFITPHTQISNERTFLDDVAQNFGTDSDYWWIYDSANTQFELNSTDTDGAGTDGVVISIDVSNVRIPTDDTTFSIGAGQDFQTFWGGGDTSQQAGYIILPNQSGSDYPTLHIADATVTTATDLNTLFPSRPILALWDADASDYTSLGHDGTNNEFNTSTGGYAFETTGTQHVFLAQASGETSFNDQSNDVDFRIKTPNLNPVFFVDGGRDGIGIGTTPANNRMLQIIEIARTSGTPSVLHVTQAAHTSVTADTEAKGVVLDLSNDKTWDVSVGGLPLQREVYVQAPTYVGDAGGAMAITDAATLYIDNAPSAGANMTITRAYSALLGGKVGFFQSGGTLGTDVLEIEHDGTDSVYTTLSGTHAFTVDAGNAEVQIIAAGATDNPELSFYQSSTQRAYIEYQDASDDLRIASNNGGIRLASSDTTIIDIGATGNVAWTDPARSGNVLAAFTLTGGAHTSATADTDFNDVLFDLSANKTWDVSVGAFPVQRDIYIKARTYVGDAGGATTITNGYTFFIDAGPSAGANMTVTNSWAAGFGGAVEIGGILQQNDAIYFTQTDGDEQIDSQADGYLDYTATTAHRFRMSAADIDGRFEFIGTTNSGLFEWMEDEDQFHFSDNLTVTGDLAVNDATAPRITMGDSGDGSNASIRVQTETGLADMGKAALQDVTGLVLVINEADGTIATFEFDTVNNATAKIDDPSGTYGVVEDNDTTVNVYYDAGNARFELNNELGGVRTFKIIYFAA